MTEITHDDLVQYLERSDWRHGEPGVFGSLWAVHGRDPVGISSSLDSDSPDWELTLVRLAAAWGRDLDTIRRDLLLLHQDEIEFAAPGDGTGISLKAGAALFAMARRAVRAAAATASKPKPVISNNYGVEGDRVARQAVFGHTRVGSYAVPVRYPLDRLLTDQAKDAFEGMEDVEKYGEPVQRRASRTLMQSLDFLIQEIIQPARDPSPQVLVAGVEAGVSRELVTAVREVFEGNDDLPFVAMKASWAVLSHAPRVASVVSIEHEAAGLLEVTSKKLGEMKPLEYEVVSGKIAGVEPVDPSVDRAAGVPSTVQVMTRRNGRLCRVRVSVSAEQWHDVGAWLDSGEVVVSHGQIRSSANTLVLEDASPLRPIGQVILPGA